MGELSSEEVDNLIRFVYYQATVTTLRHSGRHMYEDTCYRYLRELQRWCESDLVRYDRTRIFWPEFSDEALIDMRDG